jgi:hypothetical protein
MQENGKVKLWGRKKGNMVNDLRQAVNNLRALAPQLNNAVEEANRVVAVVERFLAQECQLGVEADVPVSYNEKGKAVLLMRYGAFEGGFRIVLTHSDGDSRFVTCPWAQCNRSEKLKSFPALPKLLMAVAKAVEAQIDSTSVTVTTVTQIMSALAQPIHHGEVQTLPDLAILMGSEPTVQPKAIANGNGNGHAHPHNGNGNGRTAERRNFGEKESMDSARPGHAAGNGHTEKEFAKAASSSRITITEDGD